MASMKIQWCRPPRLEWSHELSSKLTKSRGLNQKKISKCRPNPHVWVASCIECRPRGFNPLSVVLEFQPTNQVTATDVLNQKNYPNA
ncbi:hypothetical protein TNCV_3772631 [Trichonephila clavipes]|nr:hypothetical protein TNCV_3772631 [Trichonephila clavipes]